MPGPERVQDFMQKNSVKAAVCVPHYTPVKEKPFTDFNPLVLKAIKFEGVYGGLYVSPEPEVWEYTTSVMHEIRENKQEKLVALKMSPDAWADGRSWHPDSPVAANILKICQFAGDLGVVIQTHTGSDNSKIDNYAAFIAKYADVLDEYHVKIQFVHAGGSAGGQIKFCNKYFFNWLRQGLDFYADISFGREFGMRLLIDNAMEEKLGIDRILFASDEPWGSFGARVEMIKEMHLPKSVEKQVLWDNAAKLYLKS